MMPSSQPHQMQGKVCLVTGANSGIGNATALGLAKMGATVVLVCRDRSRGEEARADIVAATGNPDVSVLLADLSSQAAIQHLVQEFKTKYQHLHVLVNNAGGTFQRHMLTKDGLEYTFALNYLSQFLLTTLLLDVLSASTPARVVNVATRLTSGFTLDFANLQGERGYRGFRAYAQSKLCVMLFTYELARRLAGTGVTVNCVHPGVVRTNFGRGTMPVPIQIMSLLSGTFMSSPEAAAERLLYVATAPEIEGVSGKYFGNKRELVSPRQSYDEAVALRLWQISSNLTATPVA
jgi:retinol dehydrogenase 14